MTTNEAKQVWNSHSNKDGFISKSVDEILEHENIEGYDEVKEFTEGLNTAQNYFNIEFKDKTENEWRFTE
jgi:hypothetical protein